MLKSVLLLLVGLSGVVSEQYQQAAPQHPAGYKAPAGQQGGGYGGVNYLNQELGKIAKDVSSLLIEDDTQTHELIRLIDLSEPNRLFIDNLVTDIIPTISRRQDGQFESISELRDQVRALLEFSDDIAEAVSFVTAAEKQLKDISTQSQEIGELIAYLKQEDADFDKKLAALKEELADQEETISQLESQASDTQKTLATLEEVSKQVLDIAVDERESGSFTFLLTNEKPIVTVTAAYAGKNPPLVQYGVSSLNIINDKEGISLNYGDGKGYGYGKESYSNAPVEIAYDIDVRFDFKNKQLTAYFFDHSTADWRINSVSVTVVLVNIDNREIEFDL